MKPTVSYDHKNIADMNHLAGRVERVIGTKLEASFAAWIMGTGMMRANCWMRFMVWVVTKRQGVSATVAWRSIIHRLPSLAGEIISNFAKHIRHGRDLNDPESAGGLDRDEASRTAIALASIELLLP
jgi:hypothetical protein